MMFCQINDKEERSMRKRLLTIAAALCLGLALMAGTALAASGSGGSGGGGGSVSLNQISVRDVKADGITVRARTDTDCSLAAALYDRDGRMMGITSVNVSKGTDGEKDLPLDIGSYEAYQVKAFLLDKDTSEPVCRAATVNDVPNFVDPTHQKAVDMVQRLNIMQGYPDGAFRPLGPVTRAEFAKMICVLLNGGEIPATSVKDTPSYNDIKWHWAEGFIEYCADKGITIDHPDGSFKPQQNVTGVEAAGMLLEALGYNAEVEHFVGVDWKLYVNVQANQDGLYVDLLDIKPDEPLSREHAAQMIWNTLQAYTIRKTTSIDRVTGVVTDSYAKSDMTMYQASYKGIVIDGVLTGFQSNSEGGWTYYVDGKAYVFRKDCTDLLGQKVTVACDSENRVYGIYANKGSELAVYRFGYLSSLNAGDTSVQIRGTSYSLRDGLTVGTLPVYTVTNGSKDFTENLYAGGNLYAIAGLTAEGKHISTYDHQEFQAVDQDGDGRIDFLLVSPYEVGQITRVAGDTVTLSVVVDDSGNRTAKNISLNDAVWYDEVQRGDWVVYTPAEYTTGNRAFIEKAQTISGQITRANDRRPWNTAQCYINERQYRFAYCFDAAAGTVTQLCREGNTLNNAVVVNNYIFAVESVQTSPAADYALVTAIRISDPLICGDQAKLLFWDGKSIVVDTAMDYSASITPGTLVTYSINADAEYILQKALPGQNGFVIDWVVTGAEAQSDTSDKIGSLTGTGGTAVLNDDAVVFVRYLKDYSVPDYSYKVITGAKLKRCKTSQITAAGNAQINSLILGSRSNGVNYVEMAYVDVM